jgi:hypothetical protein
MKDFIDQIIIKDHAKSTMHMSQLSRERSICKGKKEEVEGIFSRRRRYFSSTFKSDKNILARPCVHIVAPLEILASQDQTRPRYIFKK